MTAPAKSLALAPMLRRKEHGLHKSPESVKDLRAFASAVVSKRKKAGYTLKSFAKKVGVSYWALRHVEQAENWPTMPVCYKICRLLDMQVPLMQ